MIEDYLAKLGLTEKEIALYLTVARIGIQPASVIAKKCNLDRVTAYKNLKRLSEKGFLRIYYRQGIQCFGIQSFEGIKVYLDERINTFTSLSENFSVVENLLKAVRGGTDMIPKLEIFEGESGIKRLFRDITFEIKTQDVLQVRMLTSNTFEERLGDISLSKFVEEFFEDIRHQKIDLEIFEATGNLLPERIQKVSFEEFDPKKVPAAKGTTNLFLAGHAVYIACYKDTQIGLKIKQAEIGQLFHFLFDVLKKTSS